MQRTDSKGKNEPLSSELWRGAEALFWEVGILVEMMLEMVSTLGLAVRSVEVFWRLSAPLLGIPVRAASLLLYESRSERIRSNSLRI